MTKETFNKPKTKDFTIKVEFSSNKPNCIVYDSRDNNKIITYNSYTQ
jgi:hypothetical protein